MKRQSVSQTETIVRARKRHNFVKRGVALMSAFVMLLTMNSLKLNADTLERIPMCGYEYEHVHTAACFDGAGGMTCGLVQHEHTDACYQQSPRRGVRSVPVEETVDEVDYVIGGETGAEETELSLGEAEEAVEEYIFDLGGASRALLSDVLEAVALPVEYGDIVSLSAASPKDEARLAVEDLGDDYAVEALESFDSLELVVDTGAALYVVELRDAAVKTGETVGAQEADIIEETDTEPAGEAATEPENAEEATTAAEADETEPEASDETPDGTVEVPDETKTPAVEEATDEPEIAEPAESVESGAAAEAEPEAVEPSEEAMTEPEAAEPIEESEAPAEEPEADVEEAVTEPEAAEPVEESEVPAEEAVTEPETVEPSEEAEVPTEEAVTEPETAEPSEEAEAPAEEAVTEPEAVEPSEEAEAPAEEAVTESEAVEPVEENEAPAEEAVTEPEAVEPVEETEAPAEEAVTEPETVEPVEETEAPSEEAVTEPEVIEPIEEPEAAALEIIEPEDAGSESIEDAEAPEGDVYTAGVRVIEVRGGSVTLGWGPEAGIPEDVEIIVEEIERGTADYDILYNDALAALSRTQDNIETTTQLMRFFDITLLVDGEKYEPRAAVSVEVKLDEAETVTDDADVNAIHCEEVGAQPQLVEATAEGDAVCFEAESFSVYGVSVNVPPEEEAERLDVRVDLSDVDLLAAAEVGETVRLPLDALLDSGDDGAVDIRGALSVDPQALLTGEASVSCEGVALSDGAIALPADALESGAVSLELTTYATDDYVTTATTHELNIRLTGYAGRTGELSDEGVTVTAAAGNSLPADARVTLDESAEVPAGFADADNEAAAAFDITLRNRDGAGAELADTGAVTVTVNPTGLNVLEDLPEDADLSEIKYELYHIHGDALPERIPMGAIVVDEAGNVESFTFETDGFSTYILKYTVDFAYTDPATGETRAWSFPGRGSYPLDAVLAALGLSGEITDASLALIEGEERDGALYLTRENGAWTIHSDVPFTDTYELTVVLDGARVVIVVTDEGETENLTEVAAVSLTRVSFSEQERNSKLHIGFNYTVKTNCIQKVKDDAENEIPLVYDLSDLVSGSSLKDFTDVKEGQITDGTDKQVGTFKVEGNKVYLYPNYADIKDLTEIHGSFTLDVELDEDKNYNKTKEVFQFPGGAELTVHYKEKLLSHSKDVGATAGVYSAKNGTVEVVENADGSYSLFYRLYFNSNSDLKTLKITDTLSEGQTLVDGTVALANDQGPIAIDSSALTLKENKSGFTLDVAAALKNAGKLNPKDLIPQWTNYYVTYETRVSKDTMRAALRDGTSFTNSATYDWDGESFTDTTNITPGFEERLDSSKYVGGAADSIYATSGDVKVEKDKGNNKYYLYYKVTAKPNTALETLTLTDTVGPGQTIDGSSIVVTVGGTEKDSHGMEVNGQVISGAFSNVPANTEIVMTYRVEIAEEYLGTEKTNTAEWTWKGKTNTDTTTVTPEKPAPEIGISKAVMPTTAQAGTELTYTITINSAHLDLNGLTFKDRISNYIGTFDKSNITKVVCIPKDSGSGKELTDSELETFKSDKITVTNPDNLQPGEEYQLFTINFGNESDTDTYVITYTVKVKDDGLVGVRYLHNTGSVGPNNSSDTYTPVDYGTPTIAKHFQAFDETNNEAEWELLVTVPKGKTVSNVVIKESDFSGGDNPWWLGEEHSIDWDRLSVEATTDKSTPAYTIDRAANTITFASLDTDLRIVLRTRLPEGRTFNDSEYYYVQNKATLTVDGEGFGEAYDTGKHEKSDFKFLKDGSFDKSTGIATWQVVLNPDAKTLTPDFIPYFFDQLPEGMELVDNRIYISGDGHGNYNSYGNQLWQFNQVDYPVSVSENEIGPIDLIAACRGAGEPQYYPTGLSGMTFTVTYYTRLTAEEQAKVNENVDTYTYSNQAKVYNHQGDVLKVASDTVTYEYKDFVAKYDITIDNHGADTVDTLRYRIVVNAKGERINGGNKIILSDKIGTDVTLQKDSIKIYANETGDTLLPSSNYIVSYDDNSRKLEIVLDDETYARIEYSVLPNDGEKDYTNSVVLKGERYTTTETVTTHHKTRAAATLMGSTGAVKLHKYDLYDVTQNLEGAEFSYYEVKYDPATYEIKDAVLKGNNLTTKDKGNVELSPIETGEQGKLYYWIETNPPTGYIILDKSPHYFVTYIEYDVNYFKKNKTVFKYNDLPWDVQSALDQKNGGHDWREDSNPSINYSELVDEQLQAIADYWTQKSKNAAYALDGKVENANGIKVASVIDSYTWSVANAKSQNAKATLQAQKTMYGRAMRADEFNFDLYDITDPENPVWLQTVRNTAGAEKTQVKMGFAPITYVTPGAYTYRIVERPAVAADSNITYDTDAYTVVVTVTQENITDPSKNPVEQIVYERNGQTATAAAFSNVDSDASIVVTKTISGSLSQKALKRLKAQLTFTVTDASGRAVASFKYSEMEAGKKVLVDGIVAGQRYYIEESLADVTGMVRTTTYTVDAVPGIVNEVTPKIALTAGKGTDVEINNDYGPDTTSIHIKKLWYKEGKEGSNTVYYAQDEPGNIGRVYVKLQKYVGSSTVNEMGVSNPATDWVYVEKDDASGVYVPVDEPRFDDNLVVKAPLWTLDVEGLPAGRYRVVEVEKNNSEWRLVNSGNVLYDTGDSGIDLYDLYIRGTAEKRTVLNKGGSSRSDDENSLLYGPGVTDSSASLILYNKLVDIDFTKVWLDANDEDLDPKLEIGTNNEAWVKARIEAIANAGKTADAMGVQSVTVKLQSAPMGDAPLVWTDVGRTATLPDGDGKWVAHFDGVTQKNESGQSLYYRVVETRIVMKDGSVLSTPEQIEKYFTQSNFGSSYTKGSKDYERDYMTPADGAAYRHGLFANKAKPTGITVTKNWEYDSATEEPANGTKVYFKIEGKWSWGWGANITGKWYKGSHGETPVQKADGDYVTSIYELEYNSSTHTWSSITFNDLFMRDSSGWPNEVPKVSGNQIYAVRFVEMKNTGTDGSENWEPYTDSDRYAAYTFNQDGTLSDASEGVDPSAIGTWVINNKKSKPTELKVTKNWIDKKEETNRIYFRIYAVVDDGYTKGYVDRSELESNDLKIANSSNTSIFYLDYHDQTGWDTATITIPKQLWSNNNNVTGIYVEEWKGPYEYSGKQENDENLVVTYPWSPDTGDTNPAIANSGSTAKIPAGSRGTVTITNAPKTSYITPKVAKVWTSDEGVNTKPDWPDAVVSLRVQLYKKTGNAEPVAVGDPVTLDKDHKSYTWPEQQKNNTEGKADVFYVQEESMTLWQNGVLKTLTGDALKEWFLVESENRASEETLTAMVLSVESENVATLINKAPDDEFTTIEVTKRALDLSGTQQKPIAEEQIGFKVMRVEKVEDSTTHKVTETSVVYDLKDANVTNKYTDGVVSLDSDGETVILTCSETRWPVARIIKLPRYKDGEEIKYYVVEQWAKDTEHEQRYLLNSGIFETSYTLNEAPKAKPEDCKTGDGGQIRIINRYKSLTFKKLWESKEDEKDEKDEDLTITVELHRYKGSEEDIIPDKFPKEAIIKKTAGSSAVSGDRQTAEWEYTWYNLDTTYEEGGIWKDYTYKVVETKVERDGVDITGQFYYTLDSTGRHMTNHPNVVKLDVKKDWDSDDMPNDGNVVVTMRLVKRRMQKIAENHVAITPVNVPFTDWDNITEQGSIEGEKGSIQVTASGATVTLDDKYELELTNLPRYETDEENGDIYSLMYSLTDEVVKVRGEPKPADAYTLTVVSAAMDSATNTYKVRLKNISNRVSISASKSWLDVSTSVTTPPAGARATLGLYKKTVTGDPGSEIVTVTKYPSAANQLTVTLDGTLEADPKSTATDGYGYESAAWVATWKNLPKLEAGESYVVKEESALPAGVRFTVVYDGVETYAENGQTVQNKYTSFRVQKRWMNNGIWKPEYSVGTIYYKLAKIKEDEVVVVDNTLRTLTDTTTIQVAEGKLGDDKNLIQDNSDLFPVSDDLYYTIPYAAELSPLPLLDDGWSYTAVECKSDGTPFERGNNKTYWSCPEFKNTVTAIKNNLTDISAKKAWDDRDKPQDHPAVTLRLYRTTATDWVWLNDMGYIGGANANDWVEVPGSAKTIPKNATDGDSTVNWPDLPVYDIASGLKYTYKVVEDAVPGYDLTGWQLIGGEYVFTLTNTRNASLVVKKKWTLNGTEVSGDALDEMPAVTYKVYRQAYENAERTTVHAEEAPVDITASLKSRATNPITATLPVTSGGGKSYSETISDLPMLGYEVYINDNGTPDDTADDVPAVRTLYYKYYVVEDASPGSFEIVSYQANDEDAIKYAAANDAAVMEGTITITNNKSTYALPSTGGRGTAPYYAAGTALLLLAVIAWVWKAKKTDYGA